MSEQLAQAEPERRAIVDAKEKGRARVFATYLRLSGPGWLQSALTLGGGTLASSLYLGVLAGFSLLWLQPLAMALGAIMLCAVSYVTLSIKERPFSAINRHLNPLLGWMWLIGALMANIIWALPQYALSCGVLQKNLLPGLLGDESSLGAIGGKIVITVTVLVLSLAATWMYDTGGRGIKIYEWVLRILVVGIVLSFFGVVVVVVVQGGLNWSAALSGLIPDITQLWKPAASLEWLLDAVPAEHRAFWSQTIVAEQRYALFAAASAAVGINSMFLLSYTMLRRGWDREFRGLSTFDLWCGMFLPFCLVTSCIIVSSAVQFHAVELEHKPIIAEDSTEPMPQVDKKRLNELKRKLLKHQTDAATFDHLSEEEITSQLPELGRAEQVLAWHLERKNAFDLSASLSKLTGRDFAVWIFGIGVLGMTLSTISLQMLGCGFVVCEAIGIPPKGWAHRLAVMPAVVGAVGPFLAQGQAPIWLALPASMASFTLLPLAYITFWMAMNSKDMLGDEMPKGGRRIAWNLGMGVAATVTTAAAVYMIWTTAHTRCLDWWRWPYGGHASMAVVLVLAVVVIVFHVVYTRRKRARRNARDG